MQGSSSPLGSPVQTSIPTPATQKPASSILLEHLAASSSSLPQAISKLSSSMTEKSSNVMQSIQNSPKKITVVKMESESDNARSAHMSVAALVKSSMDASMASPSRQIASPEHFLHYPSSVDGSVGYSHSLGSPESVEDTGSPEVMDVNVGTQDIDDSGFSDANMAEPNAVPSNDNTKAKETNKENSDNQSKPKRKRVRKSRAKPQDPEQKVIIKRTRRVRANDRERHRMHGLNDAMDELRKHIPNDGSAGKMTKIDTLRTACNYIRVLKMMLGEADNADDMSSFNGCMFSSGDVVMAAVSNLYPQSTSPDSLIVPPSPVNTCDGLSQELASRLSGHDESASAALHNSLRNIAQNHSQNSLSMHNNTQSLSPSGQYSIPQSPYLNQSLPNTQISPGLNSYGLDNYNLPRSHGTHQHISSSPSSVRDNGSNPVHDSAFQYVHQMAQNSLDNAQFSSQHFSGLSAVGNMFQQSSQCY